MRSAAKQADDVDRQRVFPREAVDAHDLGAAFVDPDPCFAGWRRCDDRADLRIFVQFLDRPVPQAPWFFAMHHIKLSSLVMHGTEARGIKGFMRPSRRNQPLIASATTEGGIGGNLRKFDLRNRGGW